MRNLHIFIGFRSFDNVVEIFNLGYDFFQSFSLFFCLFTLSYVQKLLMRFYWLKQIILNFMNNNNVSVIFVGLSIHDLLSNFSLQTSWWGHWNVANQKFSCSRISLQIKHRRKYILRNLCNLSELKDMLLCSLIFFPDFTGSEEMIFQEELSVLKVL